MMKLGNILFVVAMIVMVVFVDVLFFRNLTLERLAANVGIVLLSGAFYWRFFKH
jgi:hypothetical protein